MTSIYIESADEITTVIERLRGAQDDAVALVAPKGATLLQSVVNLKLARKAAQDTGKEIVVVSTDKIGRNLCAQLGIPAANTEEEAAGVLQGVHTATTDDDGKVIAGVRIHNYYDEENSSDTPEKEAAAKPEPIIIPKQMLKEESVKPEPAIAVPENTPEPPAAAEVVTPPPAAEPLTRTKIERKDDEVPTVETVAPAVAVATKPGDIVKAAKEKIPRPKEPTTPTQKRIIKLSAFLGGVALLIILTIAFLFLPITRVELAVHASDWTKQLAFSASTDLTQPSSDSTALPAEALTATSNKTLTFKPTGSKQVGDKATGTVTFYNYDTTTPITVPSGTAITASGKSFVTTADVQVPGYTKASGKPPVPGTQNAPITANEAGPDSNLSNAPANDVHTSGGVLTFNTVNTTGGTSKTVTVVSADDLTKAKADLTQQMTDDAKQQLQSQLANRDVTFKQDADVIQVGDITSTVNVGDQADSGDVSGSLNLHRTIVNTPTLQDAISNRLRADQLTNHTYTVTKQDITVTDLSSDGKVLSLSVDLAGKEAAVIPAEQLAQQLAGKTLSAGESILINAAPTATVQVEQKPGWWPVKRYPTVNRYILIDVKYE